MKFTLMTGDVVFTKDSETADDIAVAAFVPKYLKGVVCGYHLYIARPYTEIVGAFIKRFFDSYFARACFEVRANGLTRVGLSQYGAENVPIALPPPNEQRAIAAFLDRETGKIDALVEEQRRLIALLKEKRQAVISHAVTKGLDPDAPMKPSGIDWLGNVPSHWGITQIKYVCRIFPSNVDKHSKEKEIFVYLCNYTDVYYREHITSDVEFMTATASEREIDKFTLRAGDVVFTKDSETADDIAVAAFVPGDLQGVVCGYHLYISRPYTGTDGAFIKRFFDSSFARACFEVRAKGLTRVGLSQHGAENVPIALPPLDEQQVIAAFLDWETGKLDALISEAETAIDLLQERRSALISAAVTGKIDVRDEAAGERREQSLEAIEARVGI